MSRVERTRTARLDIDEIIDYMAGKRPSAADRLADQFDETFDLLARGSLIGEDMSRLIVGLRRFTMGRYVIYFEPTEFGIRVVRVLHSSRNHENLL